MASSPPPPPQNTAPRPSGGLSLYANLLQNETAATGGGVKAPIMFQAAGTAAPEAPANKINPSTLRFQPTRRHNPNAKKATPKGITIKHSASATGAAAGGNVPAVPVQKSTLDDWQNTGHSDDDLDNFYAHKQQEKERRKKKRKKNKDTDRRHIDWDDTYDPERPNVYDDYKDGEEKFREIEDWKNKLYGRIKDSEEEDDEDSRPVLGGGRGFAPPPSFAPPASFAPPSSFAPPTTFKSGSTSPPPNRSPSPYHPPVPAVEVPDDPTGEDAYARRVRLSLQASGGAAPPPALPSAPAFVSAKSSSPPPVKRSQSPPNALKRPHSPPPPPPIEATISRAPVRYNQPTTEEAKPTPDAAVISRAPIRYNQEPEPKPAPPAAPKEPSRSPSPPRPKSPTPPRSSLPGQKGFAQRLLAKYGWTSGTGLGAQNTGIVQPLQAVVSKGAKGGHGKILDRNRKKTKKVEEEEPINEGDKLSSVVVLENMLDGLPEEEVHSGELRQEIGEECQACGIVERVVIHAPNVGAEDGTDRRRVFVKFTSEVSALRAVQKMNGRLFGGNKIEAKYYDTGKFERAEWE
ncbi:hypothetical protein BJ508DRAFT_416845 [Ascobolus immersus RN42]|uniref:G-patch domain-containing protein n=1 Tax=Ascobolus immersus RN42 TaxID=1160509 RepID=A0A3N4HXH8_ASCIM|nr:hypothetical protein BJ508DRAFT_416845 [Ascobolus immersus RN42]